MITPKEQALLNRLKAIPAFSEMVTRLDLQPTLSENFRKASIISGRVDELIGEFQNRANLPHSKRTVLQESSHTSEDVWDRHIQIKTYLQALYGPQPWKYPLPHDPF